MRALTDTALVAALSPGGPREIWHGRFLREGRPAAWEAVRAARHELASAFDGPFDCGSQDGRTARERAPEPCAEGTRAPVLHPGRLGRPFARLSGFR